MCLLFCMLRGINSKEIGEEILFSSFFRKMLMPAFLLKAGFHMIANNRRRSRIADDRGS